MRLGMNHQWLSLPSGLAVCIGRSQKRWESPASLACSLARRSCPAPSFNPSLPPPHHPVRHSGGGCRGLHTVGVQRSSPGGKKLGSHIRSLRCGRTHGQGPRGGRSRPGNGDCDVRCGVWKERRASVVAPPVEEVRLRKRRKRRRSVRRYDEDVKRRTFGKCKLEQKEYSARPFYSQFHQL